MNKVSLFIKTKIAKVKLTKGSIILTLSIHDKNSNINCYTLQNQEVQCI